MWIMLQGMIGKGQNMKQNMKCVKRQNLIIENGGVEVGVGQGMEKQDGGGEWDCYTIIMTAMLTLSGRQDNGPQEVYILIPETFEYVILHGEKELGCIWN